MNEFTLSKKEEKILKECYNVDDIDALSDDEHQYLYEWIANFVGDECLKAERSKTNVSDFIVKLDNIVSYMGNQYRNGKRKYNREHRPDLKERFKKECDNVEMESNAISCRRD